MGCTYVRVGCVGGGRGPGNASSSFVYAFDRRKWKVLCRGRAEDGRCDEGVIGTQPQRQIHSPVRLLYTVHYDMSITRTMKAHTRAGETVPPWRRARALHSVKCCTTCPVMIGTGTHIQMPGRRTSEREHAAPAAGAGDDRTLGVLVKNFSVGAKRGSDLFAPQQLQDT